MTNRLDQLMDDTDQRHPNDAALTLLRMSEGFGAAGAVQLAAELGVADLLAGEPRTSEDLARATATDPGALYRLLRALAGVGVFTEVEPGRFGLTEVGDHLRADHPRSLRSWVRFQGLFTSVYAEAVHSLRTGEPTVPVVFGEPLFDHLKSHPEKGAVFNAAMGEHSRLMGPALAAAYDFTGMHRVVDVGGGDGSFLSGVLAAYPGLTGVVYDQPYVAEAAQKRLAAAGLGERCTFVGGDFLREVPPGGDAYLFKGVVHNWSDEQAVTMLRNCRRAMTPAARILLVEWVVPAGDTFHPSKFLDLAMLFVYGGRERTEEEFVRLLAAADLRLSRIVDSSSTLRVIEALPA